MSKEGADFDSRWDSVLHGNSSWSVSREKPRPEAATACQSKNDISGFG
jgi:hypothetical protein